MGAAKEGGAPLPGQSVYMGASGTTQGATSQYLGAPAGGGAKSVAIGGPKPAANLTPGTSGYLAVSTMAGGGGAQSTYIK